MAVSLSDCLLCPFCRHPPRCLSRAPRPPHQPRGPLQAAQPPAAGGAVWLEGEKLCYKSSKQDPSLGSSESPSAICIDIGASKAIAAPIQTGPHDLQLDRLVERLHRVARSAAHLAVNLDGS
ncbi:hypothetical protein F7725_010902 [Dissostichus mawsoni]|uniref:Uncharacterized protein n=1 Tax=Dissostichus mawsoni TaxID=36200 RepID=A0A7J5Z958_DISMA|nr:hypothetical protein F7725_010902 [Dissostichus mawsoni]